MFSFYIGKGRDHGFITYMYIVSFQKGSHGFKIRYGLILDRLIRDQGIYIRIWSFFGLDLRDHGLLI